MFLSYALDHEKRLLENKSLPAMDFKSSACRDSLTQSFAQLYELGSELKVLMAEGIEILETLGKDLVCHLCIPHARERQLGIFKSGSLFAIMQNISTTGNGSVCH